MNCIPIVTIKLGNRICHELSLFSRTFLQWPWYEKAEACRQKVSQRDYSLKKWSMGLKPVSQSMKKSSHAKKIDLLHSYWTPRLDLKVQRRPLSIRGWTITKLPQSDRAHRK